MLFNKDGKELWNVKTDTAFIKSQKKLSIIIFEEKFFLTILLVILVL